MWALNWETANAGRPNVAGIQLPFWRPRDPGAEVKACRHKLKPMTQTCRKHPKTRTCTYIFSSVWNIKLPKDFISIHIMNLLEFFEMPKGVSQYVFLYGRCMANIPGAAAVVGFRPLWCSLGLCWGQSESTSTWGGWEMLSRTCFVWIFWTLFLVVGFEHYIQWIHTVCIYMWLMIWYHYTIMLVILDHIGS